MEKIIDLNIVRINQALMIEVYIMDLKELSRRWTEEEIIQNLKSRGASEQWIQKTLERLKAETWHDGKPYFRRRKKSKEVKKGPADLIDFKIKREQKAENIKAAERSFPEAPPAVPKIH